MKLNRFKVDEKKEKDGVWVELGDGAKVRIARMNSPAYRERLNALLKPVRHQVANRTMPDSELDRLTIDAMAHGILLDWDGVTEEKDGKDVKVAYSKENAIRILTEYKEFRELIASLSADADHFRVEAKEVVKGNS